MNDILKDEILKSGARAVLEGNRIAIYSQGIIAAFSDKNDAAKYISQLDEKCQIEIYGSVRNELDNLIAKYRSVESEKNLADVLVQDYSPTPVPYRTPQDWNKNENRHKINKVKQGKNRVPALVRIAKTKIKKVISKK